MNTWSAIVAVMYWVLNQKIFAKNYFLKQKKLVSRFLSILYESLGNVKNVFNLLKNSMKKNIIALLAVLMLASCGTQKSEVASDSSKQAKSDTKTISVSSSIVPVSSVINAIGWEYVNVNTIVPAGVSPHGFDLSAKDVVALENSDITFLIGLEQIDGFLEKTLKDKKHIELAEGMELLEAAPHDHSDHGDEHEDEHDDHGHDEHEDEHDDHGHDEHSVDAHVWLGQENISAIAEEVRDQLSVILPEQAELFATNTETFQSDLEAIYSDFAENTSDKTPREFIVFHDAYNYMMQSAGMDMNLKVPFSENVLHESGTAHMAELIEEIELHWVVNIFSEPQFSDGNVQKFADEYNLTIGILDPLGADDSATGYLENLKTNLDNLSLIYE